MASNEPPDEGSGRPPISSFDVPIDESGADEVERKREARRNAAALPVAAIEALKLKGLGFSILPLPTEKKAPPPKDWEKASQNNPAVFLKNPGTHNYAVLPPPGVFGWDVDKEAPGVLTAVGNALGEYLPETLMTLTPNGKHLFFKWPLVERPRGPMFGQVVTRWPLGEGQGYLVGPGSVVVQENGTLGVYQAVGLDDDDPIAELPRSWAEAAMHYKPVREREVKAGPLAVVGPHYEVPESVSAGGRYDAIRDYTASMYNRGLSRDAMWGAVQAELAPRFSEALTLPELKERFERTVRDIEERLGPPVSAPVAAGDATGAEHSAASQAVGEGKVEQAAFTGDKTLFLPMQPQLDKLDALGEAVWLVDGWVPANGLVWWAGQPKSMKSLAVLQLLGAFVAGHDWMERGVQEAGTRVGMYATKEGTPQSMAERMRDIIARHRGVNWNNLRFAYPAELSFDRSGLNDMLNYLDFMQSEFSVLPPPLSGILVIDPMRDFMLAGWDENEAKTVSLVKAWCREVLSEQPWVSIVLVHHLRKSAGNEGGDGLNMSGSGATYAAGDATVNWWAKRDFADDDDDDGETLVSVPMRLGGYKVEQRGAASFRGRWSFDPLTKLLSRERGVRVVATASGSVRAVAGDRTKSVLDTLRLAASAGMTVNELHAACDVPNVQNVRTILYRASAKEECSFVDGRWYAKGWSPSVAPDGLMPVAEERLDDRDDEVWVDPLHRLD